MIRVLQHFSRCRHFLVAILLLQVLPINMLSASVKSPGVVPAQAQILPSNMLSAMVDNKERSIKEAFTTLKFDNEDLIVAFKKIEEATGFGFSYNITDVKGKKVNGDFKNQSLFDILVSFSHQLDLKFRQYNDMINVKVRKQGQKIEDVEIAKVAHTVQGTVTDQRNGEPLPGVNVLVKDTNIGTVTDVDGNYNITVPDENNILVFSFIGFITQEVSIKGRSSINVVVAEDVQNLEEVVVIGYGIQKKVNVIGSVATISNKELTASPVSNISNALAGRLPGLIVQQRSGEPGFNEANLLIRGKATLGNNAPLVVIDGIQGRDLSSINTDDVESITVLKDASAAIYGARAANGVILVTTKSGERDSPPTLSYGFYEGILSPTMLPEMANAQTYARMIREVQSYRGVDEANMAFSLEDIEKYESGKYPWTHPNTDWFSAALADYSMTRNHNLSVNGGTSNVNYYASLGTLLEDGIYKNSATSYNRLNLKVKVDINVNKFLNVGIDINGYKGERVGSIKSPSSIYSALIRSFPHEHAVFPGTNKPGPDIEYGDQPVVSPSFAPGFDEDIRYRSNNLLSANFKVPGVEGLSLEGYYSFDKYVRKRKFFEKPFTLYSFDEAAYLAAGNTGSEDGSVFLIPVQKGLASEPRLTDYFDDTNTSTINLKANYAITLDGVHNISTFIAYENQKYEGEGIQAFRRFFKSDQLPYLFAGGDAEKDNDGWVNIDSRVNYLGRLSYDYKETYLFQFSFRRDGSLRFSEENGRWGNFPSVLVGWRPSQQNWWQGNFDFIDEFKLKASWARMGNDLVDPFQFLTSYEYGTGVVMGANRGYSTALYQSGTPNPFITWEVANVYNAGFESMFLNYRMTFEADFFYERRNNILIKRNASVPNFTGITLPDENFGIVDNKGFEMILGYNEIQPNFSYGINGNFTFVRNKVVEFDEPERNVPWQVQTGLPQGSALHYKWAGIFRDEEHVNSLPHVPGARPGDIIIEDYDGDGEITNDDRILFPLTVDPEITYGVSFNVRYKNWRMSGLIQGIGRSMRRMYTDTRQGTAGNYFKYDADGRWTPDNINANKPRAFEREEEYWRRAYETDYSYQNSAYGRLKNLQISYTIPQRFQDAIALKDAQVYVSGQNLFLIYSRNKIMDPELGSMDSYPLMKVFSLGAKISL